eukprot:11821768-Ditylum_brightwellii.AAC.1
MISMSEKWGTINRGLHGGKKCHDTQTLSLIEELKHDISYSLRSTLIKFDNDAASCYDQILPNISSLIARKKEHAKGAEFVSPDQAIRVPLAILRFVDDVTNQ